MKKFSLFRSKLSRLVFLCVFVAMFCMYNTLAYLDAAATSYIIQIISGVVIACGVTVGIFWKKIRLFFRKQKMKRLEKKLAKKAGHTPTEPQNPQD